MSRKNAPDPEVLDKENKIIELRRTGATWAQVANALGYAGASGAYKAYQRAADRMVHPKLDEYRDIELATLDSLQLQIYQDARENNNGRLELRQIDRVLAIHDRRARVLGLNAPDKLQAEVVTYDGNTLAEHTQRIVELIRSSRSAQSALGSGTSESGTTAG